QQGQIKFPGPGLGPYYSHPESHGLSNKAQKQYKSKKEFKDDLDLIWSNCLTYNAKTSHPLLKCALRLKAKANRPLQNITDK
ncbi:hypothetical protein MPER_06084, partial [Moniliophthora perniciosa FA553]